MFTRVYHDLFAIVRSYEPGWRLIFAISSVVVILSIDLLFSLVLRLRTPRAWLRRYIEKQVCVSLTCLDCFLKFNRTHHFSCRFRSLRRWQESEESLQGSIEYIWSLFDSYTLPPGANASIREVREPQSGSTTLPICGQKMSISSKSRSSGSSFELKMTFDPG